MIGMAGQHSEHEQATQAMTHEMDLARRKLIHKSLEPLCVVIEGLVD